MAGELGAPPKSGWARMVPEVLVEDLDASLIFWRDLLGFEIAYQRPADRFAYLELQGAQIMLCQRSGKWETGELQRPFGRGVMLQIYLDSIEPALALLSARKWPLIEGPREVWRQIGDCRMGQREFFVQDPDGYLLMIAQDVDGHLTPSPA